MQNNQKNTDLCQFDLAIFNNSLSFVALEYLSNYFFIKHIPLNADSKKY